MRMLALALVVVAAWGDTPEVPTAQTLHGVTIQDPYRWLENGQDPQVRAWSAAQNARARATLDGLPGAGILRRRLTHLMTDRPPSLEQLVARKGWFFALRNDPAHTQQPDLVVLNSLAPGARPRVLLDLLALDPTGGTAIDWYVPSPDGAKVAVSLSRGGSEAGTLHIYDTATGKETGEAIPRVQAGTGGGSLAWAAGGKGFWYTRYPHEGEKAAADLDFFQEVWFHKLGTQPAADTYALGKSFPRIAETRLESSGDGKAQFALVENGDGGEYALWLRRGKGRWLQVARPEDGIIDAQFGRDAALWLISRKSAPRHKVLRLPLATPDLAKATVVIGEQAGIINEIAPARTRLYLVEMLGGPARVRSFDLGGKELPGAIPAPPVSTSFSIHALNGDDVFFVSESFTRPETGLVYRAATGLTEPTVVGKSALADFGDAEVIREEAVSRDGTKVPMFIIQRKGTPRDGKAPTLVNGYGGFGVSTRPRFNDLAHVLLEQGVVQVETVLRGGGEFGDAWHDAGRLTRKQNVFDDFIACAERMIQLGYTTPSRLAIEGGSNGGLLMGAALTQRPDLFKAVVSHVGIYDMIHSEDSPNGQFNTSEFGSVKDPAQFQALYAYSPYHRVKEGVAYPSVLFLTGANDPRVDPMQSRKMTARMQAANPQGNPVLLRTSMDTGHGIGSPLSARIAIAVDVDAWLLNALGVEVKAAE